MTDCDALHRVSNCDRLSRRFNDMQTSSDRSGPRSRRAPPPEFVFPRLLPRYERYIGAEPPVAGLEVDRALTLMRRELAAAGALEGGRSAPSRRH